jgi:uncharacterized phage protein (TIGR02218 family)
VTYNAQEISQRSGAPIELYRFAMGSVRVFTITSSDAAVIYLSETYVPDAVSRGAFANTGEDEQGSLVVKLPRTSPVAQFFIGYSPEPPMTLTLYRKHRSDPEAVRLSFTVGSAIFKGGEVQLTCLPVFEALRNYLPRNTCQPQCNWALYSAECGVTTSAFTVTGAVNLVSADTVQVTAFSSKPSGWLNNGWIERASGERRFVLAHAGAIVTLLSPFIDLAVGEVVTGFAGCDRTESDCLNKFNNAERFLGWPRVPTKNPFETGLA